MTHEELAAIRERDVYLFAVHGMVPMPQDIIDRRALLAEMDRLAQVRLRLQALERAARDAIPGASRAEKVGHKAAAEAYSIALALLDGDP
jgi:hypothetical protein